MNKFFTAFTAGMLLITYAIAHPADSSATITSARDNYEFVYNSKTSRVEIKQIQKKEYVSNTFRAVIPIVEDYNDQVKIDEVECKIDNRTPKDFKPEYSYYSSGDIFYTDSRMCYFPMVLIKKGTKGSVTFTETIADPKYFTSVYFSEELPVSAKVVTFKIPRWMKAEVKEMNFGSLDIKKTVIYSSRDDADIITYVAQNIPARTSEPNSPGPSYIYPHLMVLCKWASVKEHNFTYFATTKDQYGWYRELVKDLKNDDPSINAKAKELTAGRSNDMDKIKAIFYYVQDNIRYIAFENGMAGFRPEKAEEVLRKKYGDCKGMANLTKALLTSVGYDARLCWLGTNHIAYDYGTPSLAVDNHMICGLVYKGNTIYLDATETYLGINDYAERIQGRQVLMEDGVNYLLNRIPVSASTQNFDYETSKLAIDGSSLTGHISHLWKGEEKEAMLSGINSVRKENSDDAMIKYLSNNNSDNEIQNLKLSSTDDPDKDLTATYVATYKNAVSSFSKKYYVDLDLKKEFLNSAIKITDRKHDYWFNYKMNVTKETELAIPVNYKVWGVPAPLNVVNSDYEFHILYETLPGKLIYKKTILIKNTHLATSKFAQWNADIDQLAKTYNQTIELKPVSE
ncbi:hypothetical protein BH09BAC6_BH09BAC6_04910 [soil metagenome]